MLREKDTHIGPNSKKIPSERFEARRANLKQKARYIVWSVAETFVYCNLKTVLIEEDAGDIIQAVLNVHIGCLLFLIFIFHVYCMQSPVQHIMIYYAYLTFIVYNDIFYIYILYW